MRANTMNQIAVFAGLLFWSWVWYLGNVPAVPMMMVAKVV